MSKILFFSIKFNGNKVLLGILLYLFSFSFLANSTPSCNWQGATQGSCALEMGYEACNYYTEQYNGNYYQCANTSDANGACELGPKCNLCPPPGSWGKTCPSFSCSGDTLKATCYSNNSHTETNTTSIDYIDCGLTEGVSNCGGKLTCGSKC